MVECRAGECGRKIEEGGIEVGAVFCGGKDQHGDKLFINLANVLTISVRGPEVHILFVNGSISRLVVDHPYAQGVTEYLRREGRGL